MMFLQCIIDAMLLDKMKVHAGQIQKQTLQHRVQMIGCSFAMRRLRLRWSPEETHNTNKFSSEPSRRVMPDINGKDATLYKRRPIGCEGVQHSIAQETLLLTESSPTDICRGERLGKRLQKVLVVVVVVSRAHESLMRRVVTHRQQSKRHNEASGRNITLQDRKQRLRIEPKPAHLSRFLKRHTCTSRNFLMTQVCWIWSGLQSLGSSTMLCSNFFSGSNHRFAHLGVASFLLEH